MHRYKNRQQILAVGLAALAGFVDALGFLQLGGMFVSFMSGNSTQMAVGMVNVNKGNLFAGALIATFVAGVILGSGIGVISGRWRKQAVLAFVALVLAMSCATDMLMDRTMIPGLLMAVAMGAANAVFQRDGEVSVGVTYMTGTLVKLGQYMAYALLGRGRFEWVPYLLLWLGLVGGAISGTAAFAVLGQQALWIAVGFTLILLAVAIGLGPLRET